MVRQVMQKQVRLFLDQIKREVLIREERNLKGSKQVRTKQNKGVKREKLREWVRQIKDAAEGKV